MDPESVAFQPRDDLWRFQSEMLRVQQSQADLSDRITRLERRQDEDARLKNVWGSSSPFPSVLTGTPQQVPLQQPTAEHFSSFDDHSSTLIGNLQLDADDEPRRIGVTSRANSVRFDETANHGHWAHASRSSVDLIPRAGSSLGGHIMSERSYSHKSDGRQSSAGHSVHSVTSGRANSLTSFGPNTPPGLAPGLFILGPVPAIIRCWLNTNFKHDSLLYAAVCTGSYTSHLDYRLVSHLGFEEQITTSNEGVHKLKLPVYLPEAIPISASSISSSPAPQLPSLSVDFTVLEKDHDHIESKAIQIFIGSDVLRAHNADILFSSNQLILYDDDQSKLRIPLVRPEDERTFRSLYITNDSCRPNSSEVTDKPSTAGSAVVQSVDERVRGQIAIPAQNMNDSARRSTVDQTPERPRSLEQLPSTEFSARASDAKDTSEPTSAVTSSRTGSSPAIWSNWRREAEKTPSMEWANVSKTPSAMYQRRDTGIKVLKPSKPGNRTISNSLSQAPSPATTGQSRFFDDGKRRESSTNASESNVPQLRQSESGEKSKEDAPTLAKARSANPVGGATAFSWLSSGGQK